MANVPLVSNGGDGELAKNANDKKTTAVYANVIRMRTRTNNWLFTPESKSRF